MGEMAEYLLNGDDCSSCGEYIGEGDGFPRECAGCRGAEPEDTEPTKFKANKRKLKRKRKQENYKKLADFVEQITDANGKYHYLNDTSIVNDAYKLLKEIKAHHKH